MVQKIIWSNLAIQTYVANIGYLKSEWTEKEVNHFIADTERKINLLKEQPGIGVITNKRKHLRKTLIGKRILLIYRYNKTNNEIELISFFNTWQNPKKLHSI